ncbi:hypothetical protein QN362_13920 [Actimicrobium sp. CCC2.4]|nr:hypothetical protein [Actimicrobium sp. CCC2.4]
MSSMNYSSAVLVMLIITLPSGAHRAAQAMPADDTPLSTSSTDASWWSRDDDKLRHIVDDGVASIVLSGYARHGRHTYTAERIRELNEKAWGLGYSKIVRTTSDNEESLYGLAISDSHYKPQLMAGYLHQWMQPLGHGYEAGVGLTGLLISRADYFSGKPFPCILPVVSAGTRKTKLMAAYVPRLSRSKGNGDVLLMFLRAELD